MYTFVSYTAEELFEKVWQTPMVKLVHEIGGQTRSHGPRPAKTPPKCAMGAEFHVPAKPTACMDLNGRIDVSNRSADGLRRTEKLEGHQDRAAR